MKTLNGFKYDLDNEDELLTNEQLTKQARDQLVSFVYLDSVDHLKYGSILKNLNYQKSLKNDQYHKIMLEVLSNNWYDNANQTKHHNKVQVQKNDKDEDKNENVPALAFMMDVRCYCCGKVGHKSPQCQYKRRPKSEWVINKEKEQTK